MILVDHADFEAGGAAEDVLGLGGVLDAGQLHHHAVRALLLDDRLGDAQFVDPVAQGEHVLLQRLSLEGFQRHRIERGGQSRVVELADVHVAQFLAQLASPCSRVGASLNLITSFRLRG